MAETIGYTVAVLMLLLGVVVMGVCVRSSLRAGDPAEDEPGGEPAEEGRLVHRLAA